MTRVRVELRSCNQGRRENDAFALSATLAVNCGITIAYGIIKSKNNRSVFESHNFLTDFRMFQILASIIQ